MGLKVQIGRARRLRSTDALVRALGRPRGVVTVVDATAGLGRDAAALARAGFTVLAVERSPAIALLWRASWREIPDGLAFREGDAKDVLRSLAASGCSPDAVYVDAMYPVGKRRAAPRKDMVQLRAIVGDDADVEQLLEVALETALKRVVVKCSRKAPALRHGVAHAWVCSSTRYDLYLPDPKISKSEPGPKG